MKRARTKFSTSINHMVENVPNIVDVRPERNELIVAGSPYANIHKYPVTEETKEIVAMLMAAAVDLCRAKERFALAAAMLESYYDDKGSN